MNRYAYTDLSSDYCKQICHAIDRYQYVLDINPRTERVPVSTDFSAYHAYSVIIHVWQHWDELCVFFNFI